jgi:hypothetical protein
MTEAKERPDLLIVSVDPGNTSGIAAILATDEETRKLYSDEVGEGYVESEVEWILENPTKRRSPRGIIRLLSVERYVESKRPQAHQPAAQQLVGVVLNIGRKHGIEVVVQNPADLKKMTNNSLLHQLGWYHHKGEGHANDALRQCLRLLALRRATSYKQLTEPVRISGRKN